MGDQLFAAVGGDELEPLLGELSPLPGARDLLVAVRERGHRLVLASSGKADQVDHHLDLLDACDLAEAWTTSDDVEATERAGMPAVVVRSGGFGGVDQLGPPVAVLAHR